MQHDVFSLSFSRVPVKLYSMRSLQFEEQQCLSFLAKDSPWKFIWPTHVSYVVLQMSRYIVTQHTALFTNFPYRGHCKKTWARLPACSKKMRKLKRSVSIKAFLKVTRGRPNGPFCFPLYQTKTMLSNLYIMSKKIF